jgi:hypothetical protein
MAFPNERSDQDAVRAGIARYDIDTPKLCSRFEKKRLTAQRSAICMDHRNNNVIVYASLREWRRIDAQFGNDSLTEESSAET